MPPVAELKNVSKIYERDSLKIAVLENLNLVIEEQEFLALMGPSGSGKTTLLNLLAGIDTATSGSVIVAGEQITGRSAKQLASWRARNIGFIFQLYNLIPVLTAFQNVELPLLLTTLSRKERHEHVETALAIVGLADRAHHFPRQLSGGQEQRVAIARAVVSDPKLILADEPTGDLDAQSADDILHLLVQLNEEFEKTIIMVTHDPRAAKWAQHMLYLDKGILSESQSS